MPGQFNAIGEGGLNQVLQKRLVMTGLAPSPTVEPALFPSLVLENDRPEWGFLKGELRYFVGNSVTAGGAGTRSSVTLINISPSTIMVVTRVELVVASTAAQLRYVNYPLGTVLPFGTVRASQCFDTRAARGAATIPGSAARVIEDNTLGGVATTVFYNSALTATVTDPIILAPGYGIYLAPSSDNVAISSYNVIWRERQANPGELG